MKELSEDQKKFIDCINEFSGIADTANLESELLWVPHKVGAVGRSLVKLGIISSGPGGALFNRNLDYGGSVYKILRKNNEKK